MTFLIQGQNGVVKTVADYPLGARFGNLLVSYCRYLGKIFWPSDLAVYYPHPGYWPLAEVLLAGGFLFIVTAGFVMLRRRQPFLLMGWLWFVGMLVPVIGLVQVGRQSMADRYTYLPSLGVLIIVVWGVYELARRWRYHEAHPGGAGRGSRGGLRAMVTRQQLGYWQDSGTLFRHTLEVDRTIILPTRRSAKLSLEPGPKQRGHQPVSGGHPTRPDDAETRKTTWALPF